jgi:tetratricopeptide (TPR) repeat protein
LEQPAPDDAVRVGALRRLARLCTIQGEFAAAEGVITEARELARGRPELLRAVDLQFGTLLESRGRTAEAIAMYEAVRSPGDDDLAASALSSLCTLYVFAGSPDKAREAGERALDLFRAAGRVHAEGAVLMHLGTAHRALGNISGAAECYRQAIAVMDGLGDDRARANAMVNLGTLLASTGAHDEALPLLTDAVAVADRLNNRVLSCQALQNLGSLLVNTGDAHGAVDALNRARVLSHDLGMTTVETAAICGLGGLHNRLLGDPARAEELYGEALALAREHRVHSLVGHCLFGLAEVLLASGRLSLAADRCADSLGAFKEQGQTSAVAGAQGLLGRIQIAGGDLETGESNLRAALAVKTDFEDWEACTDLRQALAEVSRRRSGLSPAGVPTADPESVRTRDRQ